MHNENLHVRCYRLLPDQEKLAYPRRNYRVEVTTDAGDERVIVLSRALLDRVLSEGGILKIETAACERVLCVACRMVNAHDRDCAATSDYVVPIPHGVRVPRHDADRNEWRTFFRTNPDVAHLVARVPHAKAA